MIVRRARPRILLWKSSLITLHLRKDRDQRLCLLPEALPGDDHIDCQARPANRQVRWRGHRKRKLLDTAGNFQDLHVRLSCPALWNDKTNNSLLCVRKWVPNLNLERNPFSSASGHLVGHNSSQESLCSKVRRPEQQFAVQAVKGLGIRHDFL